VPAGIGPTSTPGTVARTVRQASGNIATVTTVELEVTWPLPFDNLNYTVAVVLEHTASPPDLVWAVRSRTTDGATIAVRNTSLGTRSCTVHALATAD
jgi:hypothetical protein